MIDWRATLAWLRGYSDAKAGKESDLTIWPDHKCEYGRGYLAGL